MWELSNKIKISTAFDLAAAAAVARSPCVYAISVRYWKYSMQSKNNNNKNWSVSQRMNQNQFPLFFFSSWFFLFWFLHFSRVAFFSFVHSFNPLLSINKTLHEVEQSTRLQCFVAIYFRWHVPNGSLWLYAYVCAGGRADERIFFRICLCAMVWKRAPLSHIQYQRSLKMSESFKLNW